MEAEQILKQLEWLDGERRKDKDIIARQEDRITALEGNIAAAHQEIKDLTSEVERLSTIVRRMDDFDNGLLQVRVDLMRKIEEVDKLANKREEEREKVRRVEIRAVDSTLAEVKKNLEAIEGLRLGLQARVDEEARLSREIEELNAKIQDILRKEEEYTRIYRLLEDGRRQDSKRMVDIQGEVTALRKKSDEQRGLIELTSANLRKLEGRLTEVAALEAERREEQSSFLEKQALIQVERERTWKEWEARLESIGAQAAEMEAYVQAMDKTHSTIKRLKDAADELLQRVDRRVNEITEVQRLSEERFRQDWITFKADDQKRWMNYTLTQEEQRSELSRTLEKATAHLNQMEDELHELQDSYQQMTAETERRLQSLLTLVHDWVATFERTEGRPR